MRQGIGYQDYVAAAEYLKCDLCAIQAVAQVESRGAGFLPSGKLKILFERHHFSRLTGRRFDAKHPTISNRKPGGYLGPEGEWLRYQKAAKLDANAAMQSASWGRFQIMGFNFAACGYPAVELMVRDFETGEPAQLRGFTKFVEANKNLLNALRKYDWPTFARYYNGPNYDKNKYDLKLAVAFREFKEAEERLAAAKA